MKVRLSDADRERLGCPEWLDCDLEVFRVREAEAFEEILGLRPDLAVEEMRPQEVKHDGAESTYRYSAKALRLRVWLGLLRAGINVAPDEADFDLFNFTVDTSAGKAVTSVNGGSPTPSRSPRSGRTGSKK